jgi:hypothetical protein
LFYLYIINKKDMSTRAKFVKEIVVEDPDTGNLIEMEVYKHENGGMFGIDTSYVDQVLGDGESMELCIPDPFATFDEPTTLYLEEE